MLRDTGFCPMYLVVDALDECERGRRDLIKLISDSLTLSNNVKWLVSSHPSVELKSPGTEGFLIELDAQKLEAPVEAFIMYKLSTLKDREGYTPSLFAEIEVEVRRRAENLFLLVVFAFKELNVEDRYSNPLHGTYALETIRNMPPGLSDLYSHMMTKINEGLGCDPQDCKTVLTRAVLAYRLLTLLEFVAIADLPPEMDPQTIVRKCGSSLTTKEESVYLIHQSGKDFLLQQASENMFPCGIDDAHYSIFLRSIQVMTKILRRDIYQLGALGYLIDQAQQLNPDPLAAARYSCIYWVDHLHDNGSIKAARAELQDDSELDGFLHQKYLLARGSQSLRKHVKWNDLYG